MDTEMQELVKRAQAGDPEAFGQIYEALAPKLYGYMYYRTNASQQLAEDLVEEVFVKVLERLHLYQDRGLPFSAWVKRIAQNHLIDHYRRTPARPTASLDDCLNLAEAGAERSLDQRLVRGDLFRALEQLTEDQRQVIVLRYLQDQSVAETARRCGKTVDAVKKLQERGLVSLRRALGNRALADLAA